MTTRIYDYTKGPTISGSELNEDLDQINQLATDTDNKRQVIQREDDELEDGIVKIHTLNDEVLDLFTGKFLGKYLSIDDFPTTAEGGDYLRLYDNGEYQDYVWDADNSVFVYVPSPPDVGDMHTDTYDTDKNGIVDNAELVNGLSVETAVPPNAVFTDTISQDTYAGTFPNITAMNAVEGEEGQKAVLDAGLGSDVVVYEWDSTDNKWVSSIPALITQVDAESGVNTAIKSWSALRVKQAIDALAPTGGTGSSFRTTIAMDKTGATDITSSLMAGLQTGGMLYVDKGNYLIDGVDASTFSGAETDTAGYTLGATVINLAASGTGGVKVGSYITFDGDFRPYRVSVGNTNVATGGTITIEEPGLKKVITSFNSAISLFGVGGIDMFVSKSIDILFHPDAVINGGSASNRLDNNVITLRYDANTTEEDITIRFRGLNGDMTYTNNGDGSTIPHNATWPIQHPGSSTNADFLSVRGEYGAAGSLMQGFKEVDIQWSYITGGSVGMQSAGGDAAIFVDGGAKKTTISNNFAENLRGSAIYCSGGSDTSLAATGLTLDSNIARNTFNGMSIKRGYMEFSAIGNKATNCVQNVQCNTVTVGPRLGTITGNIAHKCWGNVRLDDTHDVIVSNNLSAEMGFLLEGDALPDALDMNLYTSFLNPQAIEINGSGNNHVSDNLFTGLNAAYMLGTSQPTHIALNTMSGGVSSDHNMVMDNTTVDGYFAIRDVADSNGNVFENNPQRNNTAGNQLLSTSHRLIEFKDTGFLDIQTDEIQGVKLIHNGIPSVSQVTWKIKFQGKMNSGTTVNYASIEGAAQDTALGTGDVRMYLESSKYLPFRAKKDELTLQAGYSSDGVGAMIVSIQDDRLTVTHSGTSRLELIGESLDINAYIGFKAPPTASLPNASSYPNVICMNGNTGRPVYSWGGVWRYVSDDSPV